jgi:hypothetical protein
VKTAIKALVVGVLIALAGISHSVQPHPTSATLQIHEQGHNQPKVLPKPAPVKAAPPKAVAPAVATPVSAIVDTYPAELANAPMDTIIDRFGMTNRECVGYTAWKVQQTFGNMPNWTTYVPNPAPDAFRWPQFAANSGVASGSTPKLHSVAVAQPGQYLAGVGTVGSVGHVMWVESVNGNGTVTVSDYNSDETGHFGVHTVSAYGLTYIYFGG